MIVRSGGKVFLGKATDSNAHDSLADVCEIVSLMAPRGGSLAKQVLLTGVDYSSKPLKHMEFSNIDNYYTTDDMANEKERETLIGDYDKFCNPDRRIIEPAQTEVIAAK